VLAPKHFFFNQGNYLLNAQLRIVEGSAPDRDQSEQSALNAKWPMPPQPLTCRMRQAL
jgi:hypothetical protein